MLKTVSEINYIRQKGILKEHKENDETIIKKTLLDIGDVIDGTFTFGTGITAFLPGVRSLLEGEMPYLSEQSIILLYITAMWIVLNRHMDKVPKLIKLLKEEGLGEVLNKLVTFLKSLEEVGLKVAKEVGYAASSIADVGAFTFLAFPILDATLYLIGNDSITLGDPATYLKSILISIGILSVKNIFNSVIKKIKNKFGTLEESRILPNDKGICEDVFKVIKRTLFESSSQTWFLPEELNIKENYLLGETYYGVELNIGRELKKEKYLLEIRTGTNNDILIDLQINPLYEPRVYPHIRQSIVECISRFNYESQPPTLLSEQTNPKFKTFFENDNLTVTIPFTMDALCSIPNQTWCVGEKSWFMGRMKQGTPYIIRMKGDDKAPYILQHHGKVPMLLDDSHFTLYDANGNWENHKRFLSMFPELIDAFNVEYSFKEVIKYDMPLTSEDLKNLADKRPDNNFVQSLYELITQTPDNEKEKVGINIIDRFIGEDFRESLVPAYQDRWFSWDGDNAVDVSEDGITLYINEEDYVNDVMQVDDDNSFYYNQAMGHPYGDYYDEVDEDELNYMACWFIDETYDKINQLAELLGEDTHEKCHEWEDGEINDMLESYFGKEWNDASNDILTDVGYGLGRNRALTTKKTIEEELVFNYEDKGQYIIQDLTWTQLLHLVSELNVDNLGELVGSPFNEIDIDLNEVWYDSYDWDEDTTWDINNTMKKFIDGILESSPIKTIVENKKKWDGIVEKVKSMTDVQIEESGRGWGNRWYPAVRIKVGEDEILAIHDIDYVTGEVVLKDKDQKSYTIKMEDLIPNHILSRPLIRPEEIDSPENSN